MKANVTRALIGAAAFALAGSVASLAAGASPTPTPAAPAAAAPAPPSAAALASAMTILEATGARKSLDLVVPTMLGELELRSGQTRPEIKEALRDAVFAVAPEFGKTEQDVLANAQRVLAAKMSEVELKDVAAFYQSASGKKFAEVQPLVLTEIGATVQKWRQYLSIAMTARVREELKKKGIDF